MNRYFGFLFAVIVVLGLAGGCKGNKDNAGQGAKGTGAPKGPAELPIVELTTFNVELTTEFPANLQGRENVDLRPKVDGYIERLYVDEGAAVRKGQLLMTINNPQYAQDVSTAAAEIQSALAAVSTAKMQVEKTSPLVKQEIISKYELEAAQFNLNAKQAALAQARAKYNNAKTNLGYTRITSPVNGLVGTLPYKTGALVSSNSTSPLTTISDISVMYAYFSINEKQLLAISKERSGNFQQNINKLPRVSLRLADGTMYSQKGKIETVAGQLNAQTGSASVRANFNNPGYLLRSGASAVVIIPDYVNGGILVPQRSTTDVQGKKFVYVLTDGSKVKSTEIEVRDNAYKNYYVVTSGVKAGDKIVTDGFSALKDGDEIKPKAESTEKVFGDVK